MNSRRIFLLSVLCFGNAVFGSDFTKEDLLKKSLEEVQALYQDELKKLEPTKESQKLSQQWERFDNLRLATGKFVQGCAKYQTTGLFGSREDCQEALKMDRLINEQRKRIDFAERKLEDAYPHLKAIKDCLQEKEYEAI